MPNGFVVEPQKQASTAMGHIIAPVATEHNCRDNMPLSDPTASWAPMSNGGTLVAPVCVFQGFLRNPLARTCRLALSWRRKNCWRLYNHRAGVLIDIGAGYCESPDISKPIRKRSRKVERDRNLAPGAFGNRNWPTTNDARSSAGGRCAIMPIKLGRQRFNGRRKQSGIHDRNGGMKSWNGCTLRRGRVHWRPTTIFSRPVARPLKSSGHGKANNRPLLGTSAELKHGNEIKVRG